MEAFYGGKKCVITKLSRNVEWSHMFEADLDVSNRRVRLNTYRISHKDTDYEIISFRSCLVATYVQIDTRNMLLRFERISCQVLLFFSFCQLISD